MTHKQRTFRTLSLLVGGMLVAGCMDNAVAPEMPVLEPVEAITHLTYTVVEVDGGVSATCTFSSDSGGGEAVCGPHTLRVPQGAVKGRTDFKIVLEASNAVKASMTATSHGSLVENDVGAAGFYKPLQFVIDYSAVEDKVGDESTLGMGWVDADLVLEIVEAQVDTAANTVSGKIDHFSDYALIQP